MFRPHLFLKFAGALLLTTAFGLQAHAAAAGEHELWVGAAAGLAVPNKSSTTPRAQYGATLGAKIGTEFAVGAYYLTARKDEGGALGSFNFDLYGVEGTYHFEGEAKGAYFGLRMGISKVEVGTGTTALSVSPFHWGPVVGYNHMLGENLSLGADVAYYSISKGDGTTTGGATVSVDGFSTLSFLATLKLWL